RSDAAPAPARVQAPLYAGPLAGQRAPDAQAIDVVLLQSRVVQRTLECPRRQRVRVVAGLALAHGLAAGSPVILPVVGLADTDDRYGILQRREPRPVEAHRHRSLLRSLCRFPATSSPRCSRSAGPYSDRADPSPGRAIRTAPGSRRRRTPTSPARHDPCPSIDRCCGAPRRATGRDCPAENPGGVWSGRSPGNPACTSP